jgi:hemolysin activation/secretion protein
VFRLKSVAAAALALVFAEQAFAAAAPVSAPPSAGAVLQSAPQLPPPRVTTIPELRVQRVQADTVAEDSTPIPVAKLNIEGNTLFSSSELIEFGKFKPGILTLDQLRAITSRMADGYHAAGNFLAQVVIPAQDISPAQGSVVVRVLEGRYGAITVRNRSALHDVVVPAVLGSGVATDRIIASGPLERSLLLMGDLPGVQVQSTLTPGREVGTSDLLVDIDDARRVQGSVDVDNAGNVYTGRLRLGGSLQANDLLGLGDQFSARVFGASNGGLKSARVAFQVPVAAAQAGVAYTHMAYWLGGIYTSLSATGTADVGSAFATYPLLRSRTANVSTLVDFDHKSFRDDQRTAGLRADKTARVVSVGVNGSVQDALLGGGVTTFDATYFGGRLNLQDAAAHAADASTTRTDGSYSKLSVSGSRLQRLDDVWSLYGGVSGQAANKNLDVSEKMELGGVNAVRAYPEGEAYGDQGAVANVEARYDLPRWEQVGGQPQLVAFVDGGRVFLNHRNWTEQPDRRTLGGAGLGFNLSSDRNYAFKCFWAHKAGTGRALSQPDSGSRFWLQLVKYL